MAFRLKRKRHVARQASRVVAKELASAIEAVGPGGDVHEARKHLKKARAVVRLLAQSLGRDYRTLNAGLRTSSRRLSAARDAEACIETFGKLQGRFPRVLTASARREINRGLTVYERRAQLAAPRMLARVTRMLEQSARTIPSQVLEVAGCHPMRDGMDRAYRRARKAMALAREDPGDAGLHRWRRRVKDHWYQMRLLEGVNPHVRGRVRGLRRLETWLGDHHDLAVLHHLVLSAPARFGGERAVAELLGCIDKRKEMLGRRAWKNGARLFAPKPARFSRQIDRWWKG